MAGPAPAPGATGPVAGGFAGRAAAICRRPLFSSGFCKKALVLTERVITPGPATKPMACCFHSRRVHWNFLFGGTFAVVSLSMINIAINGTCDAVFQNGP
ncbi:hypothetical protein [Burkholderia anthina]|uniref:hypothetical protein n=1 Tax=Burkholderia anthina TaxID=179879 RepID=UPI000A46AAFE|nr:hypothetical protein [Burkholderia anthina]